MELTLRALPLRLWVVPGILGAAVACAGAQTAASQSAASDAPVTIDSDVPEVGITPPTLLHSGACRSKIPHKPAQVTVEFVVNSKGETSGAHIEKSRGPEYDSCALEIVNTTLFNPAKRDGKAVAVKMVLTINLREKTKNE